MYMYVLFYGMPGKDCRFLEHICASVTILQKKLKNYMYAWILYFRSNISKPTLQKNPSHMHGSEE